MMLKSILPSFRIAIPALLAISLVVPAAAEIKEIIAEATYIMGDAETPGFAEAMALQNAKQRAIEEAGTYVQSYTKTINQDLTIDEVQTIAGGLMQTEVLDKTRTLVNDGLRVSVKIKAIVSPDRIEELAGRIRGTHMAEEYQNLQRDYARLTTELESIKQSLRASGPGLERASLISQLRKEQQRFEVIQQKEGSLFERLVSGGALVAEAEDREQRVTALIRTLMDRGANVEIGELRSEAEANSSVVRLTVPLRVKVTPNFYDALEALAEALNGKSEFPKKILYTALTYPYNDKGTRLNPMEFNGLGALLRVKDKKSPTRKFTFEQLKKYTFSLRFFLKSGKQWTCRHYDLQPIRFGSGSMGMDQIAKFDRYLASNFDIKMEIALLKEKFNNNRRQYYDFLRDAVVDMSDTVAFMWDQEMHEPHIRLDRRVLQDLHKVSASYTQVDRQEGSPVQLCKDALVEESQFK